MMIMIETGYDSMCGARRLLSNVGDCRHVYLFSLTGGDRGRKRKVSLAKARAFRDLLFCFDVWFDLLSSSLFLLLLLLDSAGRLRDCVYLCAFVLFFFFFFSACCVLSDTRELN